MNISTLETKRLILRKFTEKDIPALFHILKDEEVNKFLPWYPIKDIEECRKFYENRYKQSQTYAYAICLKSNNLAIGYINIGTKEPYELGYGLSKEFWHQGIVTEASSAIINQVKKDGIPYITATHDINNFRSGNVMQKIGMKYCYSYEELWKPKNIFVIFRLYQLNFKKNDDFIYKKYWNLSEKHFIEEI